jgi:hypothetical protein
MRRMRRVGLVLIDPRRRLIDRLLDVVRGAEDAIRAGLQRAAGHHHEIGRAARHEQRVVKLQRDDDGAAGLRHQVEPVVEELTEEGEHQIERRRQTEVWGDVRDEQRVGRVGGIGWRCGLADEAAAAARVIVRRLRGRVVRRLIDDQVADETRLGVEHVARVLLVRGRQPGRRIRLRVTEPRRQHAREQLVGGAEQVLIGRRHEVVVRAVDGPQAGWQLRVGEYLAGRSDARADTLQHATRGVILGHQDLRKDEAQIVGVDDESLSDRRGLRAHGRLRQECRADAGEEHRDDHDERPPPARAELSQ